MVTLRAYKASRAMYISGCKPHASGRLWEDDCPELSYPTKAKDVQLGRDLQAIRDKAFRLPINDH